MLDGFEASTVDADETTIFIRRKGNGRPLLLLHGFPENARDVARRRADAWGRLHSNLRGLRGYGASGKPPSTPDHAPYSKGAMARDMVEMMERLGFSRFQRGGP